MDREAEQAAEEEVGFAQVPRSPAASKRAGEAADAQAKQQQPGATVGAHASSRGGEGGAARTTVLLARDEAPGAPPREVAVSAGLSGAGLAALQAQWVGREEEVARLAALLGAPGAVLPPVLVTGQASTGKTAVVRAVLRALGVRHAYVNAVETASARQLFEEVLNLPPPPPPPPPLSPTLPSLPYQRVPPAPTRC